MMLLHGGSFHTHGGSFHTSTKVEPRRHSAATRRLPFEATDKWVKEQFETLSNRVLFLDTTVTTCMKKIEASLRSLEQHVTQQVLLPSQSGSTSPGTGITSPGTVGSPHLSCHAGVSGLPQDPTLQPFLIGDIENIPEEVSRRPWLVAAEPLAEGEAGTTPKLPERSSLSSPARLHHSVNLDAQEMAQSDSAFSVFGGRSPVRRSRISFNECTAKEIYHSSSWESTTSGADVTWQNSQTDASSRRAIMRRIWAGGVGGAGATITSLGELEARTARANGPKMRLWSILTDAEETHVMGRIYFRSMPYFIVLSILTAMLAKLYPGLHYVNGVIEVIFIFDLAMRFYAAPKKRDFMTYASTWIDICASLPLVLRFSFCDDDIRGTNIVCTFLALFVPFVRGCRYLRFFETLLLLKDAIFKAAEGLPVCMYIFALMLLLFAPLIYVVEPRSSMDSIESALWFCVVTTTTVGYGDLVPETTLGRCIASCMLYVAIIYMAIPLSIVGDAFSQVWADRDFIMLRHRARKKFDQWGFSPKDVATVFHLFSQPGESDDEIVVLDLDSFVKMMGSMELGLSESRIKQLFEHLDVDDGGTVSDREFVRRVFPDQFHEMYGGMLRCPRGRS